jgi:hypothetical protein
MATAEQYAQWIVSNQDKKGTPEFETVSKAYQEAKQKGTAEQPKKEETSLTEKIFGKGVTRETTPMERIERIGTAGLTNMALGGGIGAFAGPAGMATGATVGVISGVLGEVGEQLIAGVGGSRGQQVLGGFLTGGTAEAVPAVGKQIAKAIIPYGKQIENLLRSAEPEAVTLKRQELVELAKQKLGKYGYGSVEEVGQNIQSQVDARVQRAQELAARKEKARLAETNALRQQQELTQRELETTIEKGSGKVESPYNLGTKLSEEVQAVKDPLVAKASQEYGAAKTAAMETATKNEAEGMFWAKEAGAQEIRKKWKDFAKKSSEDVSNSINKVLNDIWKKTPIKNEWGETIGYKQGFLSAEGIDQIIRKLGDVGYGKETEGYKALGADIARQLREDLTKGIEKEGARSGGFYDWSGLGAAKGKYAQALEELEKFKTARGEAATGARAVDAEKLPKQLLGSESGLRELKGMLPDPAKRTQFAQQYVHNELAGKDVAATRKWAAEHEFLTKEFPEVKSVVEGHLNKLSTLENKSLTLKDRIAQSGEKKWSEQVDAAAQKYVKQLGLEEKGGLKKDPGAIVENILNGDYTKQQLAAISKYANDAPIIRQKFPEAVSVWLSKKSPSNIMSEFDRIVPALESSGLVTPSQLAELRKGVQEVVEANRKKLTEPAKVNLKNLIMKSFGSSAARTVISGQMDIGGKE